MTRADHGATGRHVFHRRSPGDHWTIVPDRERYAHRVDAVPAGDPAVRIMTIGAEDAAWRNVFTFPSLEELTLHAPPPGAPSVDARERARR